MKWIFVSLASTLALAGVIVFCLLAFGTAKPPAPLTSVTTPFSSIDFSTLPAIETYRARDGKALSFRSYPGQSNQVAILIHGSAGDGANMHPMAMALQSAGVAVYVPDLRGHGANKPHGDVAYTGQLDDDMTDFLEVIKPRHPAAKWTLVGFSSGGGFALRLAAGTPGHFSSSSFERYVLLSPFLRYDAPTVRGASLSGSKSTQQEHAWSTVSTGRIIGLLLLGSVGIHQFDGLPVIHFAVPANIPAVTQNYSWRMQQSFQPHDDFRGDIRSISKPAQVFVGHNDELFIPEKFVEIFGAQRKDIPVTILPGLGHSDLATSPIAIHAVVSTFEHQKTTSAAR